MAVPIKMWKLHEGEEMYPRYDPSNKTNDINMNCDTLDAKVSLNTYPIGNTENENKIVANK